MQMEEKLKKEINSTRRFKNGKTQGKLTIIGSVICHNRDGEYVLVGRILRKEYEHGPITYDLEPTYFCGNREITHVGRTFVRPQFPPEDYIEISYKAMLHIDHDKENLF